jgi:hypothetical protein
MVFFRVQSQHTWALPCAGNAARILLGSPSQPRRLEASEGSPQKEQWVRPYGSDLSPKKHRKLEGKVLWACEDLLLLFHFFKYIYKRSFPIYAGKMIFKLSDKVVFVRQMMI